MKTKKELEIEKIIPEKTVLVEKQGCERQGSYDFFVQTRDKSIGIEVLTRPTQGKLKEKLCYASEVDEYIFALPKEAFELYKKPVRKGHSQARPNFFGKEFGNKRIKVWLLDTEGKKVALKTSFAKIFNVK